MTNVHRDDAVDLSIIIVTWNVAELLSQCLESICANVGQLRLEVFVVDNNSSDETLALIKSKHPEVHVIANTRNVGFAHANNQALAHCRGRHVLLLNPDTLITAGALSTLVAVADREPSLGVLGPKLVSPDGSIQLVCGRAFPTVTRWFLHYSFIGQVFRASPLAGSYHLTHWDHSSSRDVDAISGAAMLIPRTALMELGCLDESHPMYLEDVEYCWRAKRAGKRVHMTSDAVVVHYGGQSSAKVPIKSRLLVMEAQRRFCLIYGGASAAARFRVVVALLAFWRLPILSTFKCVAAIMRGPTVGRARTISLSGELANFLWAVGALKVPQMTELA